MTEYSDAYLARVLRSKGVYEMWIEDGIQDCRVYFWRWGCGGSLSVKSATTDAARKYGRHTRAGGIRVVHEPLEAAALMTASDDESGVWVAEFLRKVTKREARCIVKRMRGEVLADSERYGVYNTRKKWVKFADGAMS